MKMTKNINKILIASRLTGTLAVSTLVSTVKLVPRPPEDDTKIGILRVFSESFNILQVAERVLGTDLDNDGAVGSASTNPGPSGSVTSPGRKPIRPGRKPVRPSGLVSKPSINNPGILGQPGAKPAKRPSKPGNKPTRPGKKPIKPGNNKPSANPGSHGNNDSIDGSTPESIRMELLNEKDSLDVVAKPMTKGEALKSIKPYKFTLKNSGTVNFNANIKLNIKENTLNVKNKDVRIYITDNYGNVVMDGTFDQVISKDIRISRFMDRSFNLWAWLDKPTSVKEGKFEFTMSALATQSVERRNN